MTRSLKKILKNLGSIMAVCLIVSSSPLLSFADEVTTQGGITFYSTESSSTTSSEAGGSTDTNETSQSSTDEQQSVKKTKGRSFPSTNTLENQGYLLAGFLLVLLVMGLGIYKSKQHKK